MRIHTSLYLDVLRFGAAMLVFIMHMGFFSGYYIPYVGNFGSEAVVVFFVLSGLVVSYTADLKHTDFIDYSISRLARLWSIVVPALAITLAADKIGQSIDLSQYGALQSLSAWKWVFLLVSNALFVNQVWGLNLSPGSNGPFWSISYEFWYYVIFGLFFYFSGRLRAALVLVAVLIAGPRIVIAFPAWVIGVGLYRLIKLECTANYRIGIFIWLFSLAALVVYSLADVTGCLELMFPAALAYKKWEIDFWPKTYVISIIIAVNIYGFHIGFGWLENALLKCRSVIVFVADCTFGLYLFHFPLAYLFKVLVSLVPGWRGGAAVLLIYSLTFIFSMVLACIAERYKAKVKSVVRGVFYFVTPVFVIKWVLSVTKVRSVSSVY